MASRLDHSDFAGKKFHFLTAVDFFGTGIHGYILWNFKCDCGNINPHVAYRVINGQIRSCGCSRKGSRNELSVIKTIFRDYQLRAKNKNLIFDLSFDLFKNLISMNCHYCGKSPVLRNRKGSVLASGIDRMANDIGYTVENSITCCKICNMAKGSMSYEEFVKYLDELVLFRSLKNGSRD